jgi:hypothetical protein
MNHTEKQCQWNDAMHDASTMGLPCPRPASYGKDVRACQRLIKQHSFCSRCGGKDPGCYICGKRKAAKRKRNV